MDSEFPTASQPSRRDEEALEEATTDIFPPQMGKPEDLVQKSKEEEICSRSRDL